MLGKLKCLCGWEDVGGGEWGKDENLYATIIKKKFSYDSNTVSTY